MAQTTAAIRRRVAASHEAAKTNLATIRKQIAATRDPDAPITDIYGRTFTLREYPHVVTTWEIITERYLDIVDMADRGWPREALAACLTHADRGITPAMIAEREMTSCVTTEGTS